MNNRLLEYYVFYTISIVQSLYLNSGCTSVCVCNNMRILCGRAVLFPDYHSLYLFSTRSVSCLKALNHYIRHKFKLLKRIIQRKGIRTHAHIRTSPLSPMFFCYLCF